MYMGCFHVFLVSIRLFYIILRLRVYVAFSAKYRNMHKIVHFDVNYWSIFSHMFLIGSYEQFHFYPLIILIVVLNDGVSINFVLLFLRACYLKAIEAMSY